jgi:hypothetical protein
VLRADSFKGSRSPLSVDLVTEMKPVKHYYYEGITAVNGIEF